MEKSIDKEIETYQSDEPQPTNLDRRQDSNYTVEKGKGENYHLYFDELDIPVVINQAFYKQISD